MEAASPPKSGRGADMAKRPGRAISEAAILFDHLVGPTRQRRRQFEAKLFRCPQVDYQFEFDRHLNRQFIRRARSGSQYRKSRASLDHLIGLHWPPANAINSRRFIR